MMIWLQVIFQAYARDLAIAAKFAEVVKCCPQIPKCQPVNISSCQASLMHLHIPVFTVADFLHFSRLSNQTPYDLYKRLLYNKKILNCPMDDISGVRFKAALLNVHRLWREAASFTGPSTA